MSIYLEARAGVGRGNRNLGVGRQQEGRVEGGNQA